MLGRGDLRRRILGAKDPHGQYDDGRAATESREDVFQKNFFHDLHSLPFFFL